MRISAISEAYSPEMRRIQGKKQTAKADKADAPRDSSSISQKAKGLNEAGSANDVVAARVAGQPEIRADKVAEVREKISNGYYNSAEFVDKLADKLIQEFGLGKQPNV